MSDLTTSFFQFGANAMQYRVMAAAMRLAEDNPQAQATLAQGLIEAGKAVEASAIEVVRSGAGLPAGVGGAVDRLV